MSEIRIEKASEDKLQAIESILSESLFFVKCEHMKPDSRLNYEMRCSNSWLKTMENGYFGQNGYYKLKQVSYLTKPFLAIILILQTVI